VPMRPRRIMAACHHPADSRVLPDVPASLASSKPRFRL
jgi:hypothetical protein